MVVLCSKLDQDYIINTLPLQKGLRNMTALPDILWGPFETIVDAEQTWSMAGGESIGKFNFFLDAGYIALLTATEVG